VTRVAVGALEVHRLRFPPDFRHGVVEPTRGYLAVVLDGAVEKSFRGSRAELNCGSFAAIPAGASHSSVFAAKGCEVLVLRPAPEGESVLGGCVGELRQVHARAATNLGRRIAAELDSRDPCSALAVEGLSLELFATAGRSLAPASERDTRWVASARELLDASVPRVPSLHELGAAVERHPAHVARVFRRVYGVTVAEYARSRRVEWAASELVGSDRPLARIALDAGFADQSHFTRAFRRHHGLTPGRYRERMSAR
jgi:AraC family transcriptional regulator